MRNFIKEHPWQLEIVPAVAVALNIGAVVFYHLTLAGNPKVSELARGSGVPVGSFFAVSIGSIICLWVLESALNHKWVISEPRKRFNWLALVSQTTMLLWSWVAPCRVSTWFTLASNWPPLRVLDMTLLLLGGMLFLGLGTTALLEWRRPYIPRGDIPEPPPPASDSSDAYADTETDRLCFAFAFFLIALSVLASVQGDHWLYSAFGLLAGIVAVSFAYRKVVITPEAVTLSCGPIRKRFAIADIIECRPLRQELFTWRWKRPRKTWSFFVTTGRCLELKMRNGMTYRLGMVRPQYACDLLSRMMPQTGV